MTLKEYKSSKKDKKVNKSIIKVVLVLVIISVVLFNKNETVKSYVKDNVLKTNFSFAKINNLYDKYVTSVFKNNEEIVPVINESIVNEYEAYKDGVKVTNDSEEVHNLGGGIVIYIGEIEDYGNAVTIEQSNGIDVTYAGLDTIDVKMYSYVSEGKILGNKNESYYLTFKKNGEYQDYKEYIK